MKRPEKFNKFISAVMKEACRYSLEEVCGNYGISSEETDECCEWLEALTTVTEIKED